MDTLVRSAPRSTAAMRTALALSVLVMLMFAMSGAMKLMVAEADIRADMNWADAFQIWQVRLIGGVELLAVIGIAAAFFVSSVRWAARFAPAGLTLLMVGAMVTHFRVGDDLGTTMPAIFGFVLAAVLTVLRWGPARMDESS